MRKYYDFRYEEGKCEMGFEFVPSHFSMGVLVESFCRKIPEHRFDNPDKRLKRQEAKELHRIRDIVLHGMDDRFEGEEEL